jgi:hypothetical protein
MPAVLRLSALVAALAVAGCQPALFAAEVDVPDVCFHGIAVTFPPNGEIAVSSDPLSFSELAGELPDDLDVQIEVLELGLRPTVGVDDLDFVDRVGVQMRAVDPEASIAAMPLVTLGADDHQADGTMRRETDSPIDVTAFLSSTDAVLALDLSGELPPTTWEGEMDLCVHTRASYRKDF